MPAPWPRRPRLVAGNWKMHKTAAEGAALARSLAVPGRWSESAVMAVFPPYTALAAVGGVLAETPIHLGGQDLHPERQGAFTGEVAGAMLTEVGCRLVLVGHSERRHGMGEDDALVARKLRAAHRDGLTPIVCVGETLGERESGATESVLERQVEAAYRGLDADAVRSTVIAYEPVWAIGTGRVATTVQAREAHRTVRTALDRTTGAGLGGQVAVLYGGSVNAANAPALFDEDEVDGVLVGGASLDPDVFLTIVSAAAEAGRPR